MSVCRQLVRAAAAAALAGAAGTVASEGARPEDYYGTFDSVVLDNTTYAEVQKWLLRGRPVVIKDGALGLPMASWDCDFVQREFPHSRIRQEGGESDVNAVKMSSDWQSSIKPFRNAAAFPPGAPRNRPFYWDIAKAFDDEKHRKWGKDPKAVAGKIVQSTAVPYWLPQQHAEKMGRSSEMWFHPPGAGAPAHMDPHCKTTVSYCFSGKRKWRMMLPPDKPHPGGYFDGEIYGARDPTRRGEWQPTFELEAPAGSAVIVYPGMIHETASTGEGCSSSISQTFEVPVAAAYYRAFWPRFAQIQEDVGMCGWVVESMVTLNSGQRVRPAKEADARLEAATFAKSVDADGDGNLSQSEIAAIGGKTKSREEKRTMEELLSFHDVNEDGVVTVKELEDSWAMFATAQLRAKSKRRSAGRQEM